VVLLDDGSSELEGDVRRGRGGRADVRWETELAKLERSQIGEWLQTLDRKMTPASGLRLLRDGELLPRPDVPVEGRILLLVHGTFSSSERIRDGIARNPEGRAFLSWAEGAYDRILTFDHPTLSESPMLNARALALALGGTRASIDVVCHSRGGLVTRWWMEAFDRGDPADRRVVFVGSPLAGTGLAAPPNLKGSLSLVGNIAKALGVLTLGAPMLAFAAGVFRVVASVTTLAARTPALDAAVGLVPGLAAMSRVGNNPELASLRRAVPRLEGRYFAVQANFESEQPGWRFWRYFRGSVAAAAGAATVFEGTNDLVVDTRSMSELGEADGREGSPQAAVAIPEHQILDFGTTDTIHHVNYFEQPRTLRFVRESFTGTGA
jgi:hypothetical protein